MKYLIIGAGPAGSYAALKLRELDDKSEITVITEESYGLYARPRLPEIISGQVQTDKIILFKENWYKEKKINLKIKTFVKNIDIENKKIITNNEEKFDYDKLLIASGSKPFCPPFKIKDNRDIYMLRTIEDACMLKELAEKLSSVTVIGGGVLGLEVASNLKKTGIEVTVLERADYLLPRQLDEEAGRILKEKFESDNIKILTGVNISEVDLNVVLLDDGTKIISDFILVSAGISPVTGLGKTADLEINRGILIDDNMQTNVQDIYSAGDCTCHNGRLYGLWMPSKDQGECAALNMAGQDVKYNGSVLSASVKISGITVGCYGDIEKISSDDFKSKGRFLKRKEQDKYLKIFIKDDIIVFAVYIGNISNKNKLRKIVEFKENIKGLEEQILNECF